jgi:acetyl/propionyl-CoA carboxylase alpha subunit
VSNAVAVVYRARIDDRDIVVELVHRRPHLLLRIEGTTHTVVESLREAGAFELTLDGTVYRGWRYAVGNEVYVRLGARTFIVSCADADSEAARRDGHQHESRADMPGVVVAVHCEAGQAVASGDKLITIESMKLQATLVASHEAVVERVHVGLETAFERGAVLVSFVKPLET